MEATGEQLEVVGQNQEGADQDEGGEGGRDDEQTGDPDPHRSGERESGEQRERAIGEPRLQGVAVELVESVGGDADAEEEGAERRPEAGPVELGRRRGPERDVAQVPGGVRRVQQRDQVAPPAGTERIESRAAGDLSHRGRPR